MIKYLALGFSFVSVSAFGHGSDLATSKPVREEHVAIRAKADKPGILDGTAVAQIKQSGKAAVGVIIVQCLIEGSTACRGFKISLKDDSGETLLTANSGLSGQVGFEGLSAEKLYSVKIAHERYRGEASSPAGTFIRLDATQ